MMSVETSEVQGVASESALEDGKRAEASETRTFAKTKHEKREGRVIPSESPSVTTLGSGRHWGTRRSSLLGVWY